MICHEFKGGIGTSSRVAEVGGARYTVGALVQANYGAGARTCVSTVCLSGALSRSSGCRHRGCNGRRAGRSSW